MHQHPALAMLGEGVWITVFCLLIHFLPRRAAVFTAVVVTIGHSIGASSWLPGRCPHAYFAMMWVGIFAAGLLAITLPLPATTPRPQDDPPRVARRWILRAVVVLISVAAIYAFGIPHGDTERPVVINAPRRPPTTNAIRYGPHAAEVLAFNFDREVPGIGGTTAYVGRWDEAAAFVLWVDSYGRYDQRTSSRRGADFSRSVYEGKVKFANGAAADVNVVFMENMAGRMDRFTLDKTLYDLNKGTVFLLAAQDGEVRIKQVWTGSSPLKADKATLESLAADHPEIGEFFK
jgi:hypothetical protein